MKSNKTFNRGTIKFTFTDEDGEVFSSFRMNPTDIGLLKRAEEISKHFEDMKDRFSGVASADEMQRLNQDIEEKILSMYIKGMSTRDIEAHIRDIYGWKFQTQR